MPVSFSKHRERYMYEPKKYHVNLYKSDCEFFIVKHKERFYTRLASKQNKKHLNDT